MAKGQVFSIQPKLKQTRQGQYKAAVLTAWDALFPKQRMELGKPDRLDTDPTVRRKAKQQL